MPPSLPSTALWGTGLYPQNLLLSAATFSLSPIDTSMNVEIVTNQESPSPRCGTRKKELKNLDNHAWQNDSETSTNVGGRFEQRK